MQDLQKLDTQVLIDMLSQQTAQLTKKLADKNSVETGQYEYEVSLIQAELNSRQLTPENTNISDSDIEFTSETT